MRLAACAVRFSGHTDMGVQVTVYAGDSSAINISRVVNNNIDTLQATVFERGERKGTGQLASTSTVQAAPPTQTIVERRIVETPDY